MHRWKSVYGTGNSMLFMDDHILKMHRELASKNDIIYTPETLIGNHKYPRAQYNYEDLLLFVDVLKEQKSKKTSSIKEQEVL